MREEEIPEGEEWREAFFKLLSVMDTEGLIRIRYRLGKVGCDGIVAILSVEIARREKEIQDLEEEALEKILNRADPQPGF